MRCAFPRANPSNCMFFRENFSGPVSAETAAGSAGSGPPSGLKPAGGKSSSAMSRLHDSPVPVGAGRDLHRARGPSADASPPRLPSNPTGTPPRPEADALDSPGLASPFALLPVASNRTPPTGSPDRCRTLPRREGSRNSDAVRKLGCTRHQAAERNAWFGAQFGTISDIQPRRQHDTGPCLAEGEAVHPLPDSPGPDLATAGDQAFIEDFVNGAD